MKSFQQMGVSSQLITALEKQNIKEPTPIQERMFEPIIVNRDVIGCSSTGTGKTLAYLLPIIANLNNLNNMDLQTLQTIILVPSQELAVQVNDQITKLFVNSGIDAKSLFLIGEGNIKRQIESLKDKPAIITGTPGRVAQLIRMKKLRVHTVKTLVLDEADKLMDKTYEESILFIRKSLMKYTQVLMLSASIDKKTLKSAENLTVKPIILDQMSDSQEVIPSTIKHIFIVTDRRERIETLRKIIKAIESDKVLIFINTKYDLEESLQKLQFHHYNVSSLSGNLNKIEKRNALDGFKNGKINYLLATDVAARGLQIDQVSTVINVNLPEDSKEYLHRAGRCGRNGNVGTCITIITENELNKIKSYQKEFKINVIQKKLYQGKLVAK